MDQVRELVFASPLPAVVGLLIVTAPLGWLAWRLGRRYWLMPAGTALLAGALLLADALVQTDREQIEDLLTRCVDSVRARRAEDVGVALTEDFGLAAAGPTQSVGREQAVAILAAFLKFYPPRTVELTSLEIRVERGGTASAGMTVRSEAASGILAAQPTVTRWHIALARQPDGRWLIDRADLREINGRSAEGLPLTPGATFGWP